MFPRLRGLSALPASELAARLAEAYRLIGELAAHNERLAAQVEDLKRRLGRDSSTSSRPPSSDSPYKKKGRDRSLRERGKRRPGKQPGDPGTTMRLMDDPDERLEFPACGVPGVRGGPGRGAGDGAAPPPGHRHRAGAAPKVTEYVAQAKQCPCCGTVSEGELPPQVRARASFGPETCAQAANLTAGHHIAVYRATILLCPARGHRRLDGLDGRDPREGRRAGGGQRVPGPGAGAAKDRPGHPC